MGVETTIRKQPRIEWYDEPARWLEATEYAEQPALDEAESARKRVALVRTGFGLFWAIDAWYKWQPAFLRSGFASSFTRAPKNIPAVLQPWFQFWNHLVAPHALSFAFLTAGTETLIALCLLLGLARRPLYLLGALFSFLVWSVPEAFGRFWTAGQTDLGTSIMYVFIFVALYLADSRSSAGGWSVDRWLETRLPWWRHVAEP